MLKCTQTDSIQIEDCIEEEYSCELHAQDHFELIYIYYGTGIHVFNDNNIHYQQGDVFLLAPGDRHYFTVKNLTRFIYLRFTSAYFDFHNYSSKDDSLRVTPTAIMQIQWVKQDKITFANPCNTILRNIIDNIVMYKDIVNIDRSPIIFHQILSIFAMIKECLDTRNIELRKNIPTNAHIAAYIHENIYSKNKLAIKTIAAHFNISPSYFSIYFKRNFSVGYLQYTENLKLAQIKKRIHSSDLKLKEIAFEFGFTDVSHLSKFFKKHEGINPSKFGLSDNS